MMNENAPFIPSQTTADQLFSLSRSIAAIELIGNEREHPRLGAVMQLPNGIRLEVCGQGFDDQTVKVRLNSKYYYVFVQDLAASGVRYLRRGPGSEERAANLRALQASAG